MGGAQSQPVAESQPSVSYVGVCSPTPPLSGAQGFCETTWTKHAKWNCDQWRDSEAKATVRGALTNRRQDKLGM